MLKNANIHTACPCYQTGDKQKISVGRAHCGKAGSSLLTTNQIIFVMSGSVSYTLTDHPDANMVLGRNEFFFVPVCTSLRWKALEESTVMTFRLDKLIGRIPECHTFRFQRVSDCSEVPRLDGLIHTLTANDRIRHFLDGIVQTESDGLKCSSYAHLLTGQLMFLIQAYYTREEYTLFYSTVMSPDTVFHDQVRENCTKYRTINELADAMGMGIQKFGNRFRKVFGETPNVWLNRERARRIYHQLCSSDETIRQIAADHGFSPVNFARYCRYNFGKSPSEIRKELVSQPSDPQMSNAS